MQKYRYMHAHVHMCMEAIVTWNEFVLFTLWAARHTAIHHTKRRNEYQPRVIIYERGDRAQRIVVRDALM